MKQVNQMDVRVGDVVHFHGARFEIISSKEIMETQKDLIATGHKSYVRAVGKWLDGEIVPGYFGPGKNWDFQGNRNVTLSVEDTPGR